MASTVAVEDVAVAVFRVGRERRRWSRGKSCGLGSSGEGKGGENDSGKHCIRIAGRDLSNGKGCPNGLDMFF